MSIAKLTDLILKSISNNGCFNMRSVTDQNGETTITVGVNSEAIDRIERVLKAHLSKVK